MALSVLFLLSSIVTARLLEKKKLHIASVAYSVMFVIMAAVLLFTADVPAIRETMMRLCGKENYFNVRFAFLDAIRSPLYGAYMLGAILLTLGVQIAVTVIFTARVVAHHIRRRSFEYTIQKVRTGLLHEVCSLRLSQNVNLLYCRMLS